MEGGAHVTTLKGAADLVSAADLVTDLDSDEYIMVQVIQMNDMQYHQLLRVYSTPNAPGVINFRLTITRKIALADLVECRRCSHISIRACIAR